MIGGNASIDRKVWSDGESAPKAIDGDATTRLTVQGDFADYTKESWAVLEKILAKYQDLLKTDEVTEAQLKDAAKELEQTIAKLVKAAKPQPETPRPQAAVNIGTAVISGIKDVYYTGKTVTQQCSVTYNGKVLKAGTDYRVTYADNTKPGTAKMTVTGIGNYTGTQVKQFKILLKTPAKLKAKKAKDKIRLSWKKTEGADGYEIYRSSKKNAGFKKVGVIKKAKQVSIVDKKTIKKKETRYYRVRAFAKVNGKKVYSDYVTVKYTGKS